MACRVTGRQHSYGYIRLTSRWADRHKVCLLQLERVALLHRRKDKEKEQGKTGRVTDRMSITDGWTDAWWYSWYTVRHWPGIVFNSTASRQTWTAAAHFSPSPAETDRCPSLGWNDAAPLLMHTQTHTALSSSFLHLSAPCCQSARQEVMFVPLGTVIFSFSPFLNYVSFPFLFFLFPLLCFPFPFCVAFTIWSAAALQMLTWKDSNKLCVCWWQNSRYEYDKGFVTERVHEQLSECKWPYMDALLFSFSFCLLFLQSLIQLAKVLLANYFSLWMAIEDQGKREGCGRGKEEGEKEMWVNKLLCYAKCGHKPVWKILIE